MVFLREESVESLAQHRGSIRTAADIANANEKDRRRFGIPLQAGHGPPPPLCVQQPFAEAPHDAWESTVKGRPSFLAALVRSPLVVTYALSIR